MKEGVRDSLRKRGQSLWLLHTHTHTHTHVCIHTVQSFAMQIEYQIQFNLAICMNLSWLDRNVIAFGLDFLHSMQISYSCMIAEFFDISWLLSAYG